MSKAKKSGGEGSQRRRRLPEPPPPRGSGFDFTTFAGDAGIVLALATYALAPTASMRFYAAAIAISYASLRLVFKYNSRTAAWPTWRKLMTSFALPLAFVIFFREPVTAFFEDQEHSRISKMAVQLPSAYRYDGPTKLSTYIVAYHSPYGQTVSPIFFLLDIAVTNAGTYPETIMSYTVAVGDEPDGPWNDLVPIDFDSDRIPYAIGIHTARFDRYTYGTMDLPIGTARLGSSMKPTDLAYALRILPDQLLNDQIAGPIEPGATARGWFAFDLRRHDFRGVGNYYRVTLRDGTGGSSSSVIETPRSYPGDTRVEPKQAGLTLIGTRVDLSGAYVRYYSDPYPQSSPLPRTSPRSQGRGTR